MKIKQLMPVLFLVLYGCEKDAKINEVPDQIVILNPCSTLVDSTFNIKNYYADTIYKKIVVTKSCKVYVTFLTENAGYKNTLGWYTYKEGQTPLKKSDINQNVLFPNISLKDHGGELETGYTLELGKKSFPSGTVIGFFLVVNGWEDCIINFNNTIYYTDSELNESGKKQYLLFKDPVCHEFVIGFEDSNVELNSYIDFNDVIFLVSDNNEGFETGSFELKE
jgi:hypothetical protein